MKPECNFAGSARILNEETVMDVIKELAEEPGREDPFYVLDVGDVVQKIKVWRLKMPRVKPFYAVKCNDDQTVLEILAALGTGFDCASKVEMQKVLQLGVDPSRIVYAHPCKPASHLRHAAKLNVSLITYDNETELHKIKAYFPQAKLVVRIRYDAVDAQCLLGMKFGVLPEDAGALLATARDLDLNIVGVSFHVGSGCHEPAVFYRAIAAAKRVFEEAQSLGFNPYLLDIGGGFPGASNSPFDELAGYVNKALDEFFPEGSGVEVIAEPGRYVVASAFTLTTNVVAKREVTDDNNALVSTMYYINDGVYGSFNGIIYGHQQHVHPTTLQDYGESPYMECSIWGPTCDGLDQVMSKATLPRLSCGDWLVWSDMGAYTITAAAGSFNGFPLPKVHVVIPHHTWLYLEEQLGMTTNFGSLGGASVVDGGSGYPLAADIPPAPAPARLSCAAATLPDHLARLAVIDVAEM